MKWLALHIDMAPAGLEPVEAALDALIQRGAVVQEHVAKVDACYLRRLWEAELSACTRLNVLLTAEADEKRALAWYKRSAKLGFLPAQMACAAMYEGGNGTAMNMKRALYWYEQAAKQGSVPAQLKCGRMYYCGRAENRNPKKARIWLEAAAGAGNEDAQKLLSEYF